ncbi:hypothetical protein GGX14DRAFT_661942 [Mycena pura]|uniref:Uncharacterized protein n=1 Tax=Mycena pura TaxID=153505 RepID=A0AAD6Y6L1_9AGAR|nr:hypothetical protein GGX14DRAFT_661942 [Mycena pura]
MDRRRFKLRVEPKPKPGHNTAHWSADRDPRAERTLQGRYRKVVKSKISETRRNAEGFKLRVSTEARIWSRLGGKPKGVGKRNKADVGIDPNARSAQGRSGRSGPKASGARYWIKHKSLGSPNEKCGTCEESNDQAYKARKSEREDRGCTQTRTKVSGPEPS